MDKVTLSPREKQVFDLLCAGDSQAQIALRLGLARKTVNQYVAGLRKKTRTKSTIAAVAYLLRLHIPEL
jgi:DNA-binding CsgD family transcriptional regulator